MKLSAPEYIAYAEKCGVFSPDAGPDAHPGVWREYLALYQTHISLDDIPVIVTDGGMGFAADPLDDDGRYVWALTGPVSHPQMPFTAGQVIGAAGDICTAFGRAGLKEFQLRTDSFFFSGDPSAGEENHFLWLNSPRAAIPDSFEAYTANLKAERRKQMRRLYRDYNDDPAVRFEFSDRPPDAKEFDFILGNTRARWGEDWAYALVQTLWPLAVSAALPRAACYMRVYQRDKLAFLNSYIVRGPVITSQSTCRSEDIFMSGMGVMVDFKAIELLTAQKEIRWLDPTCRTGLEDPDSIGVAKREIVNEDARKAILIIGESGPDSAPWYDPAQGWQASAEPVVIGRAV